jgi:hypothetical protein
LSPFSRAFDHVLDCEHCDYAERRLCPTGRVLFQAAHDAAVMLASPEPPETKNQA